MEKHQILIFGDKTFGGCPLNISSDLFETTFQGFPSVDFRNLKRLSNYSFIILDYAVFERGNSVYEKEQEIFEKQLFEVLTKGATVVFLHYDEKVPRYDQYNCNGGYMNEEDKKELLQLQIGFRFLDIFSIKPFRINQPIHWGKPERTEFKNFLDKWGSSKNAFVTYGKVGFGDLIQSIEESALSFSNDFRNGTLIYLPCQRNYQNTTDLTEMFQTMIDNLITYTTRLRTQIPDWAQEPFFNEEEFLFKELQGAQKQIEKIEKSIEPYNSAKSLTFSSEYKLQKEVPEFLKKYLGLNILQDETYNEDFWILDSANNKIAICEVKSYVKGFRKSGVYDTYNHREFYKLEESFPAILFVNLNLNSASWKQKLSPIAPQDYKIATSNNILILRVEDLLFLWDAFKKKKVSKDEIIKLLTSNIGWLYFKPDGNYEIKQ